MSPRERNLIVLFAAAGFLVVNFLLYSWFNGARDRARAELEDARLAVERAEMQAASRELVANQMDWLAQHEPEPIPYLDAQTNLQQFVEREARAAGLTIRTQSLLPVDASGTHFHRAKVQFNVTGNEDALYRWFDRIKSPEEFRVVTRILMSPNRENDALIDCTADIDQWFISDSPDA
jgi:type II secretory pathway component PulM